MIDLHGQIKKRTLRKRWTPEEDQIIRDNWMEQVTLYAMFPRVTHKMVDARRRFLGLKRPQGRPPSTGTHMVVSGIWDLKPHQIERIVSPPTQVQTVEVVALPSDIKFNKTKYAGMFLDQKALSRPTRKLGACVTTELLGDPVR